MTKLLQIGLVALLWVSVFILGAFRPAKAILDALFNAELLELLLLVPCSVVLWGWTNIAILSLLAGVAGVLGRAEDGALASGAARGFFVFLLAISGQLFYSLGFAEPSLHFPNHHVYFRLAALVSAGAFAAGWSPNWLGEIFTKIGKAIEKA